MSKIKSIADVGFRRMGVDENNKLYWNGQPIVTEEKIKLSSWVNISIIIGAISTALYAIATVLDYLNIYIN